MQEKINTGNEAEAAVIKQEQKLLKQEADIEERRRQQVRLAQEVERKKEE